MSFSLFTQIEEVRHKPIKWSKVSHWIITRTWIFLLPKFRHLFPLVAREKIEQPQKAAVAALIHLSDTTVIATSLWLTNHLQEPHISAQGHSLLKLFCHKSSCLDFMHCARVYGQIFCRKTFNTTCSCWFYLCIQLDTSIWSWHINAHTPFSFKNLPLPLYKTYGSPGALHEITQGASYLLCTCRDKMPRQWMQLLQSIALSVVSSSFCCLETSCLHESLLQAPRNSATSASKLQMLWK